VRKVYNILNRANFSNPPATLGNALGTGTNSCNPGSLTRRLLPAPPLESRKRPSAGIRVWDAQRQIQFSLRFNF